MTRLVARGLLAALVLAVFLVWMIEKAPAAAAASPPAAPKPDPQKPLRFGAGAVTDAMVEWSLYVLVVDTTRDIDFVPERVTCRLVARRPQRWRCDVGGTWYLHGDAVYATYRLRRCRPDRDAWTNALYRVRKSWRASVSVDYRGGLRCRLVEPPYIPDADA